MSRPNYTICNGGKLPLCGECRRHSDLHKDAAGVVAPVFSMRPPIEPRLQGDRCWDFLAVPQVRV